MWETRTLIWVVVETGMAKAVDGALWNPTSRKKKARYPDFLCSALSTVACAAFIKESRLKLVRPTRLNRKIRGYGAPKIRGQDSVSG
jgi:hypothetical protein